MGDRTPFVVGILAIVSIVAWLLLRGDTAQPREIVAPVTRVPVAQPPPPRPALPAVVAPEDPFASESRDDAWARATERELARRWKQIRGGVIERSECRTSRCELVITGTRDALAQTVIDLGGPRGLHGYAANTLVSSPTAVGDTVTLRVVVSFAR